MNIPCQASGSCFCFHDNCDKHQRPAEHNYWYADAPVQCLHGNFQDDCDTCKSDYQCGQVTHLAGHW